ncbi:E4 ORFB [African pygmy hedgehog adenovirus 1]|nr:E4 ORFB [African pygmy hedgehog adenovirus 1]
MASCSSRFFYECHIALKDNLAEIIRNREVESEMCRDVALFLKTTMNLTAIRRLSSHSSSHLVSSIIFVSLNEMFSMLKEEVQSLIKVYLRGWIEGLGSGIGEDLHDSWLNKCTVNFFSC